MPCSPCVYRKQTANTSFLLPVSEVHLKTARLNCFVFQTWLGIASVILILHCSGSYFPQVHFFPARLRAALGEESRGRVPVALAPSVWTKPCCSLLLSGLLRGSVPCRGAALGRPCWVSRALLLLLLGGRHPGHSRCSSPSAAFPRIRLLRNSSAGTFGNERAIHAINEQSFLFYFIYFI